MYKFYVTPNKTTIAVSSYAGKTVKGIAKLNPNDEYNEDFGKKLAAARCALKIAKKRKRVAVEYEKKAEEIVKWANERLTKAKERTAHAFNKYEDASLNLKILEAEC